MPHGTWDMYKNGNFNACCTCYVRLQDLALVTETFEE